MGMEQDTRIFFILIVNSIALVLLWMIGGIFFGIFLGYGFFDSRPDWKNMIFYITGLLTLFLLVRHLVKKWSKIKLQ
jgi:ABC-type glycerol-3-phosphate transport system permease component